MIAYIAAGFAFTVAIGALVVWVFNGIQPQLGN